MSIIEDVGCSFAFVGKKDKYEKGFIFIITPCPSIFLEFCKF